ncbi:hypothetical protein LTR53_009508 [Teratosphaeriaceae sp. CCFEE 6253]|nr:hypothetical protein LTR53_009508 [Teratosphaeriaceae sp. CCFEE 6253]
MVQCLDDLAILAFLLAVLSSAQNERLPMIDVDVASSSLQPFPSSLIIRSFTSLRFSFISPHWIITELDKAISVRVHTSLHSSIIGPSPISSEPSHISLGLFFLHCYKKQPPSSAVPTLGQALASTTQAGSNNIWTTTPTSTAFLASYTMTYAKSTLFVALEGTPHGTTSTAASEAGPSTLRQTTVPRKRTQADAEAGPTTAGDAKATPSVAPTPSVVGTLAAHSHQAPIPAGAEIVDLTAEVTWIPSLNQFTKPEDIFNTIRERYSHEFINAAKLVVGKAGGREHNLNKDIYETGNAIARIEDRKHFEERSRRAWPRLLGNAKRVLEGHVEQVSGWGDLVKTRKEQGLVGQIVVDREERLEKMEGVIERTKALVADYVKHGRCVE